MEIIKPFVKWAGGKGSLISQLTNFYPFELKDGIIEKYVEPFVGGGAVLIDILQKYDVKEAYAFDINKDLINCYNVIKAKVEELIKEYPNCRAALKWWCDDKGEGSRFSIRYNKLLKEFLITNPPNFPISNKCCKYAKKDLAHVKLKQGYDLNITGVRKAEGGVRANAYKSCFDNTDKGYDNYRPIFWFKDDDKLEYKKLFNVFHSKCYSVYGLKRTGCCGCPYGKDNSFELKVLEEHEPKLYKAVTNIFKDSYEYTKLYQEFKNKGGKLNEI